MADVQFLFDNQLISELENLIKNSKNKLLLISPFIDIDKRIEDALREKLNNPDFELQVLFGKNENNIFKSIKNDSLIFLKKFPNIEIRYNERLHAKFYLNDFHYIMTSLNLYDYSLAKNIEVGIICNYKYKGLLFNALQETNTLLNHGAEAVKQDILGMSGEINPVEKFKKIFNTSELKYKTEPITVNESGLKGLIGVKKLIDFKVLTDELKNYNSETKYKKIEPKSVNAPTRKPANPISDSQNNGKLISASQLSKLLNVPQSVINNLMQNNGLTNGLNITEFGTSKGLMMKNYMCKDYIAYPENLTELNSLK